MMQKLGIVGFKSLDHLRSLGGSIGGSVKNPPLSNQRASMDSASLGSFANLKLTAEKLVKEQASVKTDLELVSTKLKKSTEQIHLLETKLQEAHNENAKLEVKQTEDSKLWKGLDSKLLSTKTLCSQLTETVHHLAGQVRAAEEDKIFFEGKLLENSKAFDDINLLLNDLSSKLEHAGKMIKSGEQEILKLRQEKEEMERHFRDECDVSESILKERDAAIKQLQVTMEEKKVQLQNLDSQLQKVNHELLHKEATCNSLKVTQENLETEKNALQCSNKDFLQKIHMSDQEIRKLQNLVCGLTAKLVELDEQSRCLRQKIVELFSTSATFYDLVQQEKDLIRKSAQEKFDGVLKQFSFVSLENDALKMEIEELKKKIMEFQKAQEIAMVEHADECRLAEDKIRSLESEAEILVSKKSELEKKAAELEEKVNQLSETSSLTENQMQELRQKIVMLESENQDVQDKMFVALQEKAQDSEAFQNEIARRDQCADSLKNEILQLQNALEEKEEVQLQLREREKLLGEQILEIQASLAASEFKLAEARKQYDLMIEGKQLELSKHLKELSQRNDQAINEIRRKYEMEKVEIANAEKEKAEKLIRDMETSCEEKISENKEEAKQYLMHVKEEHATLISKIQQDHEQKESSLREHQKEELQKVHLQAENEMRERITSVRKEHEIQIKSLKLQYEDDCQKLQEELELQKAKEEKQRALLQLQWKVMGDNQQDDQEVNSKKEYSVSSIKMRDTHGGKEHHHALARTERARNDVNLSGLILSPMTNLLKKVEKTNPGSKHSQKVTRHEYEVETSNGRTIKRRKTKSTVMIGQPNTRTPRARTPNANKSVMKIRKVVGGPHAHPSNIGDLFSEGALNPYTDDPYAFD